MCAGLCKSSSTNTHACRQYRHLQKLGVSPTQNATFHSNLLSSLATSSHLHAPARPSLEALLPESTKNQSKCKSLPHPNLSQAFRLYCTRTPRPGSSMAGRFAGTSSDTTIHYFPRFASTSLAANFQGRTPCSCPQICHSPCVRDFLPKKTDVPCLI